MNIIGSNVSSPYTVIVNVDILPFHVFRFNNSDYGNMLDARSLPEI